MISSVVPRASSSAVSSACVTARAHHASSLPAAAADGLDGDGGAGGLDGDGGADGLDGDEDEVAVL